METLIAPRPLASGPVATVYAARRADTGAEVAVKAYSGRIDHETATWLGHERQALNDVHAPEILRVDEVFDLPDGRSAVRMALCHGSLAALLSSGAGSPGVRDALGVGFAVAQALAAAHRVGVIHGSVTPHNVLWHGSGEFVVSDFGLALRERFPRDPSHALDYTAPETSAGAPRSPASDLYGLGAVLHLMLTGAPPSPHHSGRSLRTPDGDDVPDELYDAVRSLLAKDPAARPANAAKVATLFERLLTTANPPRPTRSRSHPPREIRQCDESD